MRLDIYAKAGRRTSASAHWLISHCADDAVRRRQHVAPHRDAVIVGFEEPSLLGGAI
jgi:hypothetical protein